MIKLLFLVKWFFFTLLIMTVLFVAGLLYLRFAKGYLVKDMFNRTKIREVLKALALQHLFTKEEGTEELEYIDDIDEANEKVTELNKSVHYFKQYTEATVILQLAARMKNPDCAQCLIDGACTDCGCDVPEKMVELDEVCSLGHWGLVNPDMPLTEALSLISGCVCMTPTTTSKEDHVGLNVIPQNEVELDLAMEQYESEGLISNKINLGYPIYNGNGAEFLDAELNNNIDFSDISDNV